MQTTFVVRHMEESPDIKAYFEDRVSRIRKYLMRFKEELTTLHASLDKNPHKGEYFASLSLYIPSGALHCRERAEDAKAALSEAFLDMARQIEKHKDKLTREKRRKLR